MTRWLFDTGVWLAMAEARPQAAPAKDMAADGRNEIATSAITLAELVSVLERRGRGGDVPRILSLVRRASNVLPFSEGDLEQAGLVHARERAHHRDFSLADALILTHAKAYRSWLLTTDKPLTQNRQGVRTKLLA